MKKFTLFSRLALSLLLPLAVAPWSCKQPEKPVVAEVLPDKKVLMEFSQSPPVVQDIFLQKMEGADSVALSVTFSEEENRLRGVNALPLTIDEKTKLTLNDRGISGDRKAGDGIFSIAVKANDNELKTLLTRKESLIALQDTLIRFGRRIPIVKKPTPLRLDSLEKFRPIQFQVFFSSSISAANIDDIRNKSLMITDPSVVDDPTRTFDPCPGARGVPDGVWSFKTLITNMAGTPADAKKFLTDWVDNFLFSAHTHPVSGDATANRSAARTRLIKAWFKNSGLLVPAIIPPTWKDRPLKVEGFPVRLLAIINRVDLRGNSGYTGGFDNAGEGRFVFSFVDSNNNCKHGSNGPGTMTFILEYGIPIKNCQQLVDFGRQWWDLHTEPFGESYNKRLEAITKVFTSRNANPERPNGSALNHFRTNDFLQTPWDIRDFEIDRGTQLLKIIHPNHEPLLSSNGFTATPNPAKLASMVAFANSIPFSTANPNPSYSIPDDIKGMQAPMPVIPPVRYHWVGKNANVISSFKRREFSFNTCSGCHKGETNNPFTHVRPRDINVAAKLSGFMTGMGADDNPDPAENDLDPLGDFWVNDPGPTPQPRRGFNEARTRAESLEDLVFNSPCIRLPNIPERLVVIERILRFRPLNMPH